MKLMTKCSIKVVHSTRSFHDFHKFNINFIIITRWWRHELSSVLWCCRRCQEWP